MKLEVQVTEADIKQGLRGHPGLCPIACAMRRTLDPISVEVFCHEAQYLQHGGWVYLHPDGATTEWIELFDLACPVRPFTATFEVRQ